MYPEKPFTLRLLLRFVRYSIGSGFTFMLDVGMLAGCIALMPQVPTILLMTTSFFIAISINYWLVRTFVYPDSTQTTLRGYLYFLSIGAISIGMIIVMTLSIVSAFGIPLIVARIMVGLLAGCGNFLANTFLNFKVV